MNAIADATEAFVYAQVDVQQAKAAMNQHVVDATCTDVGPATKGFYFLRFRCLAYIQDGRHGHLLVYVVDRVRFRYQWA